MQPLDPPDGSWHGLYPEIIFPKFHDDLFTISNSYSNPSDMTNHVIVPFESNLDSSGIPGKLADLAESVPE